MRIFATKINKDVRMLKKLSTLLLFFVIVSAAMAASSDTLVIRIKGMRCEEEANMVNKLLRPNAGVEDLIFNMERRTVTVAYDSSKTNPEEICAALNIGRYKPSAYSKTDVIRRGMGLRTEELQTQADAERIMQNMSSMVGIDSLAPNLAKRYVFIRYDANKTDKATIREKLESLGFTPVTYYTSKIISFAYFKMPAEADTEENLEIILALDGVEDVNANPEKGSLAITYVNTQTTEEKLLSDIQAEGIEVKSEK